MPHTPPIGLRDVSSQHSNADDGTTRDDEVEATMP